MEYELKKYESNEIITKYVEKMQKNTKDLEESFAHLKTEIAADLRDIDKAELVPEQNRNIHCLHKYMTRLSEEQYTYKKIKAAASKIEAELMDYYRFNWDKSTKLTESAVTKYALNHRCYIAINDYMKLSETINNHLENIISIFKDRNYAIKNIIEIRKIELGL